MAINVAEFKVGLLEVYEHCAAIAEKCGDANVAAQIRKAAGTLIVKATGTRGVVFEAEWQPPKPVSP